MVAFDWAKEMGTDAPLTTRLRGVTGTAVEARLLAAQVDSELRTACAAMAAELGHKGDLATAPVACQAAQDALKAARAELGPKATVDVNVHPALCPEPLAAVEECAKRCGGDDHESKTTCAGTTVGRCPGTCDGACEVRQSSPCDGVCMGRCEGTYNGPCPGTCKGTCNGAEMPQPGECKGTCEGSCDSVVKGHCKGNCAGGCVLKAATCAGACAGKCSVPPEEPKCLGVVKTSATTVECATYCELRATHRATCGAAQVDAHVRGAPEVLGEAPPGHRAAKRRSPLVARYERAIARHLPAILKVEAQLKDHVASVAKSPDMVASGLKAIAAGDGAAGGKLTPCLIGYDRAAAEGASSVLASYRAAGQVIAAAKAK